MWWTAQPPPPRPSQRALPQGRSQPRASRRSAGRPLWWPGWFGSRSQARCSPSAARVAPMPDA
eukprot:2483134-Lingulodinium_polyedra.AAC.1